VRDKQSYKIGDIVYVRPDNAEYWLAELLEIRAADAAHVFLRIFWLYRPEDLPEGRKDYHGEDEIIPSNQMQIIDAMTINCKVNSVSEYDEQDDSALKSGYDGLLWRQTLDVRSANKALSALRSYCVCGQPSNPNIALVKCDESECDSFWMHQACLIDAAVQKAYNPPLQKSLAERDKDDSAFKTPEKDEPDVADANGGDSITLVPPPLGLGWMLKSGFSAVNSILRRSLSPHKDPCSGTPVSSSQPRPSTGVRCCSIKGREECLKTPSGDKPPPSPSQPVKSIEAVIDITNDLEQHANSKRKATTITSNRKKGTKRPKKTPCATAEERTNKTQDLWMARQYFSATLLGLSDKNYKGADGKLRIEIEDLRDGSSKGRKWTEPVVCLKCGHELE